MNRDQKAAVIDEIAEQIEGSEAVLAVDYRGISVPQIADLRAQLDEADASFRIVKNRLTVRAADKAGVESLKELLEGPTAFMFVRGDAALAAKVIATFRREHQVLEFKGGTMDGATLSVDEIEAIAKLPTREVLHGQLVGVLASPVTGLVRGLHQLIQGLASQLGQIAEQGLVTGGAGESGDSTVDSRQSTVDSRQDQGSDAAEATAAAEEAPVAEEAPAAEKTSAPEETSGEEPAEDDAPSAGDEEASNRAQPAEPAASQEKEG